MHIVRCTDKLLRGIEQKPASTPPRSVTCRPAPPAPRPAPRIYELKLALQGGTGRKAAA